MPLITTLMLLVCVVGFAWYSVNQDFLYEVQEEPDDYSIEVRLREKSIVVL
jgi:hypothetical protein